MNNKEKLVLQDLIMQSQQINYMDILNAIKPIIIFYAVHKSVGLYTLHRNYKPKNISKVTLPPELNIEYSDYDIKEIAIKKYGEKLVKFTETVINNFKEEDLKNFYNNIKNLNVKTKNFTFQNLILRTKIGGSYNLKKNEISLNGKVSDLSLYHELFHMASSRYENGIRYSGFHQSSIKGGIMSLGEGINEGYTELLTKRLFENDVLTANSYEYLVFIVSKLEEIVGKEKLQSLYLNSNLKGLIEVLKKYMPIKDVMEFIANTDFLVNHLDDVKLKMFEKNMINKCLKNVNRFLIICYCKKLQRIKKAFGLSYNKFLERIAVFISTLTSSIKIGKNEYNVMTKEDYIESIRKSFENSDITFKSNDINPSKEK